MFNLYTQSQLSRLLLKWYDCSRRDLPWRVPQGSAHSTRPDPYYVLVSELMLQQTQVATVIPYFRRFLQAFPTVDKLAQADTQQVLRLWQGLGYYRRANNLQATARAIISEHHGKIPSDLETLLKLPGVGRYTAGAIASIAFDRRVPILDGNVARVLCRLDAVESDPREKTTLMKLWLKAGQILPSKRVGDFNSALMELGATVCTPRNPACRRCPLQKMCQAFAKQIQDRIPPPRKAKTIPTCHRHVLCICKGKRWLIEQRPAKGRWAGMWQFVTVEASEAIPPGKRLGQIKHALTHRLYQFDVWLISTGTSFSLPVSENPRKWVKLAELHQYPLPRPHQQVAAMLAKSDHAPAV